MSIAVCAVIHPSRLLRLALAAFALACALAALLLASGAGGRFHAPLALAAACAVGALQAGRAACRPRTTRLIDISGPGAIGLLVQHSMGSAPPQEGWQLAPGCTLWPALLLLLLRAPGRGAITVVAVLPDSVSPEQFRKIGVAIRAIARQDNKFVREHKIL